MQDDRNKIGIYYEHPDWFKPLFGVLDRRQIAYEKIDAACHSYDPTVQPEYGLLFNRMSASAYLRGHGNAMFYTRGFLAHLEQAGVRVINGRQAFDYETSKALQLELFARLGLGHPKTRVVNCAKEIPAAATDLSYPIIVKPNIGGRGAGIVLFESEEGLRGAIDSGMVDLGIDSTALVQEFVPKRGGHITRVETLAGRFLYALNIYTSGENFNLCPAEICQVDGVKVADEMCLVDAPKAGLIVERFDPPADVIESVERIVAEAGIDVGGIEYMIDDRDGRRLFYDINALSNFVADAPRIVGFDPHERLVDYLEKEMAECVTVTGSRSSVAG